MNIERREISIRGLPVDVVRKGIKNLHRGVYPPYGRVRVAAPLAVSDEAVRLAVIGKLGWIKRQWAKNPALVVGKATARFLASLGMTNGGISLGSPSARR
jgi:predicted metal-dependent hydrolase